MHKLKPIVTEALTSFSNNLKLHINSSQIKKLQRNYFFSQLQDTLSVVSSIAVFPTGLELIHVHACTMHGNPHFWK